ncbi:MAG TPA: peroxiredoxin [Pseudomonadota bacterium]|nr:peroxiredoxin [Pseudomonadota bacterium]
MTEITEATRLPLIGDPAPAFEVESTHGVISLDSYKGKWIMLFSHPADFTPVCTTEFIAFAEHFGEFQKRNADILGVSIDSIYSHLAWVQAIKEKLNVTIPFPVIADLDMKVASAYGMIHPGASDTSAVRSVFIIDDKQNVRALVYYPMSAGRSIDEILRLLDALQTGDKHGVACPAGWKPGDKVVVPAPKTQQAVEDRLADSSVELKDWYLSLKKLS